MPAVANIYENLAAAWNALTDFLPQGIVRSRNCP